MARLSGVRTESFSSAREVLSSASSGLGSLVHEQKARSAANRVHVLGLSSPLAGAAVPSHGVYSPSSSPFTDSSGFLNLDDTEINDEDLWGFDMIEGRRSHLPDPLRRTQLLHAYELSSPYPQTNSFSYHGLATPSLMHSVSRTHADAPKQPENSISVGGIHSAHYPAMDKSIDMSSCSMAISTKSVLQQLPSVKKPAEPRQVAHQGLICSRSIRRAGKRILHDSYLLEVHQSAPLKVPNCPKILENHSANDPNNGEEAGQEDDEERLPPHELLAREYAHKERMAFSVCEGYGRTLKGRDMRRVRNAVWRQIGFAD